jgi:hypothetical protein
MVPIIENKIPKPQLPLAINRSDTTKGIIYTPISFNIVPRTIAAKTVATYDQINLHPFRQHPPTLSPTLSAIVAGLRGHLLEFQLHFP